MSRKNDRRTRRTCTPSVLGSGRRPSGAPTSWTCIPENSRRRHGCRATRHRPGLALCHLSDRKLESLLAKDGIRAGHGSRGPEAIVAPGMRPAVGFEACRSIGAPWNGAERSLTGVTDDDVDLNPIMKEVQEPWFLVGDCKGCRYTLCLGRCRRVRTPPAPQQLPQQLQVVSCGCFGNRP